MSYSGSNRFFCLVLAVGKRVADGWRDAHESDLRRFALLKGRVVAADRRVAGRAVGAGARVVLGMWGE